MKKEQLIELAGKLNVEQVDSEGKELTTEQLENNIMTHRPGTVGPDNSEELTKVHQKNKQLSESLETEIKKSADLTSKNEALTKENNDLKNQAAEAKKAISESPKDSDTEAVIKYRKAAVQNEELKKRISELEATSVSKQREDELKKQLRVASDSKREEIKKAVAAERESHKGSEKEPKSAIKK